MTKINQLERRLRCGDTRYGKDDELPTRLWYQHLGREWYHLLRVQHRQITCFFREREQPCGIKSFVWKILNLGCLLKIHVGMNRQLTFRVWNLGECPALGFERP